jgi:hypothetical protein
LLEADESSSVVTVAGASARTAIAAAAAAAVGDAAREPLAEFGVDSSIILVCEPSAGDVVAVLDASPRCRAVSSPWLLLLLLCATPLRLTADNAASAARGECGGVWPNSGGRPRPRLCGVASVEDEEEAGDSRGRGGDCNAKAKGWLLKKRCGEFIDDDGPCAILDRNAGGVIIAAAAATAAAVVAAASPTAAAVVGGWIDDARSSIQSAKEAREGKEGRIRKRRKRGREGKEGKGSGECGKGLV